MTSSLFLSKAAQDFIATVTLVNTPTKNTHMYTYIIVVLVVEPFGTFAYHWRVMVPNFLSRNTSNTQPNNSKTSFSSQ